MLAQLMTAHKLRIREILLLVLGTITTAGLMMLWFGAIPQAARERGLELSELTGLAGWLVSPALQIPILLTVAGLLAAGLATRVTTRNELRPLVLLMAGCLLGFFALATTVNTLADTIFKL